MGNRGKVRRVRKDGKTDSNDMNSGLDKFGTVQIRS